MEGWNPRTYGPLPLYLIKFASSAVAKFVDPVWTEYRHTALVERLPELIIRNGHDTGHVPPGTARLPPSRLAYFPHCFLQSMCCTSRQATLRRPIHSSLFLFSSRCCWRWLRFKGAILHYPAFCGIAAGFAIASKFNGIGLAPVVIVAAWMHAKRRTALPIAITAMVAAFLAGAPYALLDPASFWGRIATEQTRVVGANLPWNVPAIHPHCASYVSVGTNGRLGIRNSRGAACSRCDALVCEVCVLRRSRCAKKSPHSDPSVVDPRISSHECVPDPASAIPAAVLSPALFARRFDAECDAAIFPCIADRRYKLCCNRSCRVIPLDARVSADLLRSASLRPGNKVGAGKCAACIQDCVGGDE